MRLFVGVELGADVVAAAQRVIGDLRARVEQLDPAARITWIPPHLMHLTVRFIGEVPEPRLDALIAALGVTLPAAPFTVAAVGVGAFSSHGVPRVIWGGLAQGTAELRRTERLVTGRLEQVGIAPDEREFSPHLTLARVRDARNLRSSALLAGYEHVPLGTGAVDAITLFQSRVSANGPTYVPLHRTVLQA